MSEAVKNERRFPPAALAAALLVMVFCAPLTARHAAHAASSTQTTEVSNSHRALMDGNFAAFFDAEFPEKMRRWHIPGAVIVVVRDGQVAFAGGYGYADVEKKLPVVPDRTEFRIGSVSKLFVATAVMQLAEKHQVDLHADVNPYLKNLQVPNHFARLVTLADLLTHTGGFDERVIGLAARRASDVPPLGAFLAAHLPPLVSEPGAAYSYSNYGMALAAFVVEQVSGVPFDRYVEQNILAPLGMRHTGFERTPEVAANLATGYVYHSGRFEAEPYDYFTLPPASGMNSTAADMARFMLAHLDNGSYDGAHILDSATARLMEARQFGQDPRLPGRTYGFYERYRNGLRGIGHGGNIRGYGSLLFLLPDEHTGLFISTNRDESRFVDEIEKAFLDRFYPAPHPRRRRMLRNTRAVLRVGIGPALIHTVRSKSSPRSTGNTTSRPTRTARLPFTIRMIICRPAAGRKRGRCFSSAWAMKTARFSSRMGKGASRNS
jgi:CubicO group peptidase (beta-lactamase class C family)